MTEKIEKMIESMTTDEIKQRLAAYMAADELHDYLAMLSKGYTATDFAQKYRLSEQQMKHFLTIVSSESNRILNAA